METAKVFMTGRSQAVRLPRKYRFEGTEVEIRDKKGGTERIRVLSDIPYGHKIAVREIPAGASVIKYRGVDRKGQLRYPERGLCSCPQP